MAEPQKLESFSTQVKETYALRYWQYLPEGYTPGGPRWPLLLFLHGAGEMGTDAEKVKKHGPPKLIAAGQKFTFIVISPQCPDGIWWEPRPLRALLEEVCPKLNVDQGRVYCTGLSMGGFGTWELAITYPQLFAAIVPICGGGSPYIAARIRHIPTWVFHGGRDNVVPLYESQRMVDALKRAGANVQLTVYPEAGHDSWTETYNNPDLYTWLLSHRRRPAGTPPTRPG